MGHTELVDGRVLGAYPELLQRSGDAAGCQFHLEVMPRARTEMLFQKAYGDLLLPASRTPQRDAIAEFVPLLQSRPTLVYLPRPGLTPPRSIEALLASGLRVALVRGYDYGPAYKRLERGLQERRRLVLEADPQGVARALAAGLADATVLNRHHLQLRGEAEPRLQELHARLRVEPLEELGWSESGVYLSTRSLTPEDRTQLRRLFEQAAATGLVWQVLSSHYGLEQLEGTMRPRER
jgi:polar amino acid transport system substrate-binding protein